MEVWEAKISDDRVVFRPIEKTRSLRRRETAPGRRESHGTPPDYTHPNVGKRITTTTHAVVHNEPSSPPSEAVKSAQTSAQTSPSAREDDELDQLYENRKATVSGPAAVQPKEPPPQPADVPCCPPDPLYVRRVGQRFWSTKRILDWQRQALRAREDSGAVLKPIRDYGEDSVFKCAGNGEAGFHNHGGAHYENGREHAHNENDRERAHYENDNEHANKTNDREHAHDENDIEHAQYENDREHAHYQNGKEHEHYENDREHVHYQNDREHAHYQNDREHAHYQNDREHEHYENDREHAQYVNDREHAHYVNDREHVHYENDREHEHYENDREQAHYKNDREHKYYQYDKNHMHYKNDDEQSNLSTHVYADLDPDFLAAQDAIQKALAQPFYEMDISPVNDEEEQPFYKMDVTAVKDQQQEEPPFYEMDADSADKEKEQQPFYEMDDSRLGQPASSSNVYAGLDPEFVAAQDEACRRRRAREPGRGAGDDDPRCSQNCRVFFRSRPGCMVAVFVGIIISVIVTVVFAVIFNPGSEQSVHIEDVMSQTTLPTASTMSSAQLTMGSEATWWATEGKDWQLQWTLYIRDYFGENSDVATALEERYAANEVVMSLLQDRFFWYWELQKLYLRGNALALSLSSLARAFVNMSRLEYVEMFAMTCRAASFRMAAQQARDAIHTIAGQVRQSSIVLYDGSGVRKGATQELAWQHVRRELQTGVSISSGKLTVCFQIRLLGE
ncbi:Hypp2265 [Branchiostoma lanceolatum]|uniref:Hypp2265 protein n=1 Tax=Branchiostoma lanceolatum TaxID=7740 RepID=A0A8K0EM71_BRALA|nr:Hypp2265 [Branchiostoma lanceolatum]